MPRLLFDHEVRSDIDRLNKAWDSAVTFVFLPEKSGVDRSWVTSALNTLPPSLQENHFILLTSGSTGQPKLVVGSKNRAEALAKTLHDLQKAEPVQQAIVVLPLTYCYAFVNQWLWARSFSRALVITDGFSRPELLGQQLSKAKSGQLCLVRSHVSLLETHFPDAVFSGILRLHFAGSRFPQERLSFLQARFPSAMIFNNYGCTEAMPRLCLRQADDAPEASDVGLPLPGVRLKTDASGQLVFQSPFSAVACVDANGFHAFGEDEWIGTGDMGRVDERGHAQILGRSVEVFKRHGEKISLSLVQETISKVWPKAVAFYRERDKQGEEGYVLLLAPTPSEDVVRQVLTAIRKDHPRSHWPLRLESIETLPMLENSKVDASKLPLIDGRKVHWYYRA